MSNDEQKDAEFPDEHEPIVAEAAAEPRALPQPEADKSGRKGGGAVAWLALFLALVSAAGFGYMAVQDWRARTAAGQSAESMAELRERVTASANALSAIDDRLAGTAASDAQFATELDGIRTNLDTRLQLLDSLPPRLANLENSVASLQGVSTGARNTWLLAEAEYYMQIANAQLQLAGNPRLAALALEMADERITQLADPALTDVRRALSDELTALEVMEKPDIAGITLTLSSLARIVDSLPLRQTAGDRGNGEPLADSEQSGMQRAWASVKGAASGLVRVTPPSENAVPLMTPEAEYFLRTNLALHLQVARLALLRGEQAVFEQSLDDASRWLETYFDTRSAQVGNTLESLAEIREHVFVVAVPDISGSLRLLRQFKTIAGTGTAQ